MKKEHIVLLAVLFACLTFFLPLVFAATIWTNQTTVPDNFGDYLPQKQYFFQIEWQNASVVMIEHNFTADGSLQNATMYNVTSSTYRFNITDLAARTYVWRSYGNDSGNILNVTSFFNYTVHKALPLMRVWINGTTSGLRQAIPEELINITIELIDGLNVLGNPYFEVGRPGNASQAKDWFYAVNWSALNWTDRDIGIWDERALKIDTSRFFEDGTSLRINVTYVKALNRYAQYGAAYDGFPVSKVFNISANVTYEGIFYYKEENLTLTNIGRGFVDLDVYVENNDNGATCGNFTFFQSGADFGNTCIISMWKDVSTPNWLMGYSTFNFTIINQSDGWQKFIIHDILLPYNSRAFIAMGFYDSAADENETGIIYFDNVLLLKHNNTLNKTLYLNTSFPNWSSPNGTSPLQNKTAVPSQADTYNITGIFFGDANYSLKNATRSLEVGARARLIVQSDKTVYAQGALSGSALFYANITANYTNATSGRTIQGATCTVTNNETLDSYTMSYTSTSQLYNYSLRTENFYALTGITVSCTGNKTFLTTQNTTTFEVQLQNYYRENINQSLANGIINTTKTLLRDAPLRTTRFINGTRVETGIDNNGTLIIFYFLDTHTNPNSSLARDFSLRGNATVRANISSTSVFMRIAACVQLINENAVVLRESCSAEGVFYDEEPVEDNAADYTLFEFNVSVDNWELKKKNYLTVAWKYNATKSSSGIKFINISYNNSVDPDLIIYHAEPLTALTIIEENPKQQEGSFRLGPNERKNITLRSIVSFNNTLTQTQTKSYTYSVPLGNVEIRNVVVQSSTGGTIASTRASVNSAAKSHQYSSRAQSTVYQDAITWTSEAIPPSQIRNETVTFDCECLHQEETLLRETTNNKVWQVTLHSHLFEGKPIYNVTAYTNYSLYGVFQEWNYHIQLRNSSGTYNITNLSTIQNTGIVFPSTTLSENVYTINATAKSNGASCSINQECGSNLCCSNICSSTCTTVTASTGTGGGGGGSAGLTPQDMLLSTRTAVPIMTGGSNVFDIIIMNPIERSTLKRLNITLHGFLPGYYTINPPTLESIPYNETRTIHINITAPRFLSGNYLLNVTVEGVFVRFGLENPISKSITTTLFLGAITSNKSAQTLAAAEKEVQTLIQAGLGANRALTILEDAKHALVQGDFTTTNRLAEELLTLTKRAFTVNALLQDVKAKISEADSLGINLQETKQYYDLALQAFQREEYEKAEQRINNALLSYAVETKVKLDVLRMLRTYWYLILLILLSGGTGSIIAYKKLTLIIIKYRIDYLSDEEVQIRKLMKEAQTNYYRNKDHDSAELFHKTMYSYEKRLAEIKRTITHLISHKAQLIKLHNELKDLHMEDQYLQKLMKEAQTQYFLHHALTKMSYQARIQEYETRRTEIMEQIQFLKSKPEKKPLLMRILKLGT